MKKLLLTVGAALLAGSLAALAANTTFFTTRGDAVFPFSAPTRSAPGAIDNMTLGATTPASVKGTTGTFTGALTATQVNAALGAYANDQASTTSYPAYTFANGQTQLTFTKTGTTTYAYVTLAAAPYDGLQQCVFSRGAITTLYVFANAGQSIVGAVSTLAANALACYQYSLATTTWNRTR